MKAVSDTSPIHYLVLIGQDHVLRKPVGTVGILAAAAGKRFVSLRASFDALRATTFRDPDGLMDELLRMDESRR